MFGEQLPEQEIQNAFLKAQEGVDVIVVGTSGVVQPVASIPFLAKGNGGRMIEINPNVTDLTSMITDVHIHTKATVGTKALELALSKFFS
jgi:NAD-dependent deacetylase